MSPEFVQLGPLILIAPLLIIMALHDLKFLKISNFLVLAMIAVFLLSAPFFLTWQEISYRILFAVAVFFLGFAGFAFRLWGGGDVKAIAALVLFVPSYSLLLFFFCFAASMGIGMFVVVSCRFLVLPQCVWSALRPKAGYPMGVSIAMAGILLPFASLMLAA
ncbi:prepilin peptidase [Ruegeria arenilitoris]|uniref:prepilin peptidase n=1 Tax=Ruegeria arenilitoris TaxID=1173585 RepID=UPI00147F5E0A|nr:prepilin peptidase [Ruegeria arenilitoris]